MNLYNDMCPIKKTIEYFNENKNLSKEEKYVLNLLRNRKSETEDENTEEILNLIYEHKLLFTYYEQIKNDSIFIHSKKNIEIFYNLNILKSKIYCNLLEKLFFLLNQNEIECYLYKGYALEMLTYNTCHKRMYDDIDIVLKNNHDIVKFYNLIKNNFEFISCDFEKNNEYINENKIEIKFKNFSFIIEIKTIYNENIIRDFSNDITLYIGNTFLKTFSYAVTVNILVNYIYYYSENIISLEYSNRMHFSYMVDLYNLLTNKKTMIEEVIKVATKEKKLHKLRLIVQRLDDIFDKAELKKMLLKIKSKKIDYLDIDLIDYGRIKWKHTTIQRYFNKDLIAIEMVKDKYDEFLIGECNNNYLRSTGIIKNVLKYNVHYNNDNICLCLKNETILSQKYVFYILLFCYDLKNEFIKPFLPIFIVNVSGEDETYNYTISRNKKDFNLNNLQYSNKYNPKQVEIDKKKDYTVKINCSNMGMNQTRKIGLNFYLHELDEESLISKKCYSLQEYHDLPLLLKYGD